MMNKSDSQNVRPLVENSKSMEALLHYVGLRVSALTESLLYAQDMNQVKLIQGAVEELKRFKTLRDEVNNPRD